MEITAAIVCSSDLRISTCLKSIPEDTKILVILNNPSTQVINIVDTDNRINCIRCDESNLGKLRQLAVENINTPGILFIDSDCEINKDTMQIVSKELDVYPAVSIPLRFKGIDFFTRIVSKCREFTTPADALFIPSAFRINIQDRIGGYLYDKRLNWGEDTDPKKRLLENGLLFIISNSTIWHDSLSIFQDMKSAIRLGRGRYIRVINDLAQKRKLIQDLSLIREIKLSNKCLKISGFWAAIYHFFVWRPSYKFGYWREVLFHGKG
ncbi:MAG: glycosyltransferase family 2 protein [Bacteroidales bacterium]|jgi:hypothetical protein|nr:glycosyltransferase family 2 protein [Bacteroidales bacterium]